LELGGSEAVSPLGVVRLFEQSNGRSIELQFVPAEALEAQQAAATDPMQQSFSGLMRCVASGDPIDISSISRTFAIQLTKVEDYVKLVLTPA
ncbi:MAG TPA: hypothetical protein VJ821_17080, partial [Anaerolineales bacterium]|nr:hypothetical protein [Anaerolineales bacterium]